MPQTNCRDSFPNVPDALTADLFEKCYNVRLMPMLHGCAFPGCETFTLSAYCFEHELVLRAERESERAQLAARDEPTARELTETTRPAEPTLGA